MRSGTRAFFRHLAGYASAHAIAGLVLASIAAMTFAPGGEAATRWEAVTLHLFVAAALLCCSGVGYAAAVAFVGPRHAALRFPALLGTISGALVVAMAGFGGVGQLEKWTTLSSWISTGLLGYLVGLVASVAVLCFTTAPWSRAGAER